MLQKLVGLFLLLGFSPFAHAIELCGEVRILRGPFVAAAVEPSYFFSPTESSAGLVVVFTWANGVRVMSQDREVILHDQEYGLLSFHPGLSLKRSLKNGALQCFRGEWIRHGREIFFDIDEILPESHGT